jgi:hypothetical protein
MDKALRETPEESRVIVVAANLTEDEASCCGRTRGHPGRSYLGDTIWLGYVENRGGFRHCVSRP